MGNDNSMVAFEGSVYTLPLGSKSVALEAPLRIWSRTGTVGGTNVAPLMKKAEPLNEKFRLSA